MRRSIRLAATTMTVLVCGCGGATGHLAGDAAATGSPYVVLDLDSGRVEPVMSPAPEAAAWSGHRILFRRLPPAEAQIGRPVGDDLAEEDEHPPRRVRTGLVWMGVYEVTQAQWEALGGGSPWHEAIPFLDIGAFVSPDRPAIAISPNLAVATLAAWSPSGWTLDLPTATEWEYACLAGGSGKFSWGSAYEPGADGTPVLDDLLVCDRAGTGLSRPQPVGSRLGNDMGFHDMHGNAWELVHDGLAYEIRGGAWDSGVLACRASNHVAVERSTAGWNVGLRLVLRR